MQLRINAKLGEGLGCYQHREPYLVVCSSFTWLLVIKEAIKADGQASLGRDRRFLLISQGKKKKKQTKRKAVSECYEHPQQFPLKQQSRLQQSPEGCKCKWVEGYRVVVPGSDLWVCVCSTAGRAMQKLSPCLKDVFLRNVFYDPHSGNKSWCFKAAEVVILLTQC